MSFTGNNPFWIRELMSSWYLYQFPSVAQLCPTLCHPMDCSRPGLPVYHQLPEFTQTHVHFTFHFHALEKEMATHSSVLAWRVPGTGEPGGLQSMRSLESDTTERLPFHFSLLCIEEGNGNPLQCSYLENPRDGGAW